MPTTTGRSTGVGCRKSPVWQAGSTSRRSADDRNVQYHNLNVEDTISKHSDYQKYIIVRHPLQRVVSGFYEIQRKHDPEGNMKNFTQALRDYIISEAFDLHWVEFYDACHPCNIKYDAILKVEMLEMDIKSLNREFHLGSDKEFPSQRNRNCSMTSCVNMM